MNGTKVNKSEPTVIKGTAITSKACHLTRLLPTNGVVLSHSRSVKITYRRRDVFYIYTYKSDYHQKKAANLNKECYFSVVLADSTL